MLFARFVRDIATDVIEGENLAAVEARYHPDLIANWNAAGVGFEAVPDGTLVGAIRLEGGAIANPSVPPSPVPQPVVLTKVEFMRHAVASLGGPEAGVARYETVIIAARASVDPGVPYAMEEYTNAREIERDAAASMLDIMVGYGTGGLTQAERDAVINNWPMT